MSDLLILEEHLKGVDNKISKLQTERKRLYKKIKHLRKITFAKMVETEARNIEKCLRDEGKCLPL